MTRVPNTPPRQDLPVFGEVDFLVAYTTTVAPAASVNIPQSHFLLRIVIYSGYPWHVNDMYDSIISKCTV